MPVRDSITTRDYFCRVASIQCGHERTNLAVAPASKSPAKPSPAQPSPASKGPASKSPAQPSELGTPQLECMECNLRHHVDDMVPRGNGHDIGPYTPYYQAGSQNRHFLFFFSPREASIAHHVQRICWSECHPFLEFLWSACFRLLKRSAMSPT